MYDFVNRNKRLLEIILVVLIVPPFALFGVDWYFRGTDSADQVASVGRTRITQQEFGQALRARQEQLRRMMGGKVDQATLDSPDVRRAVLDQLIDERISYTAALKSGMNVPVAELRSLIGDIPAFKDEKGQFSPQRYRELLNAQGMTEGSFEATMRKDMIISRNRELFAGTAFLPNAVVERLYKLRKQQREVSQVVLEPAQYAGQVRVTDDEVKAFYGAHKQEFEIPEKVKLEYVMLTQEAMQKQVSVTPEEIKQAYEERGAQQQKPEERRASHILIVVPQNATPEQKSKAKEKAQALLEQAKKSPKSFAELAKKNSEDPGSAVEGGDLGWSPRGRMVKPFDDALFGMKVGEIAGADRDSIRLSRHQAERDQGLRNAKLRGDETQARGGGAQIQGCTPLCGAGRGLFQPGVRPARQPQARSREVQAQLADQRLGHASGRRRYARCSTTRS
jgi:peptidyl-prolyl cis-trans isomerase D